MKRNLILYMNNNTTSTNTISNNTLTRVRLREQDVRQLLVESNNISENIRRSINRRNNMLNSMSDNNQMLVMDNNNSIQNIPVSEISVVQSSNQNLISNISSQGNPLDIELITTQINNQSSNNILDNIRKKQSEQEELRNEIEASITNVISESEQINTEIQNINENVLEINQELQEVNDQILNLGQSNSSSYSGLLLYGGIGIVSIFLYEYYIRNRIFRSDTVNVTNPNLDTGQFIGFGIYRNGGNSLPSDQPTTISDRVINFLFDRIPNLFRRR